MDFHSTILLYFQVTVSYSKYKMIPDNPVWDDDEDDDEDEYFYMDDRKRDIDWYETKNKEVGELPKCGYKKVRAEAF